MRNCSLQFLILKKKSKFLTTALFLTFTNLWICMLLSVCLTAFYIHATPEKLGHQEIKLAFKFISWRVERNYKKRSIQIVLKFVNSATGKCQNWYILFLGVPGLIFPSDFNPFEPCYLTLSNLVLTATIFSSLSALYWWSSSLYSDTALVKHTSTVLFFILPILAFHLYNILQLVLMYCYKTNFSLYISKQCFIVGIFINISLITSKFFDINDAQHLNINYGKPKYTVFLFLNLYPTSLTHTVTIAGVMNCSVSAG